MGMMTLSIDAFAREGLCRDTGSDGKCDWCGQHRTVKLKAGGRRVASLFIYGTERDSYRGPQRSWFKGEFCGLPCFRSYHQ